MLMRGATYAEVLSYMEKHDKGVPDDPFGVKHGGAEEDASHKAQAADDAASPDTEEKPE